MSELPEGWTKSDLGSIAEIYQPETISKAKLVPDGDYPVYGANGPIGRYDRYNHEEPELLVTCRGATCGAVNISEPKSWINGNAMVVRLDRQLVDFSFSEAFFQGACDYSGIISGSAQPQITRQSLSPVHFPIPPLPEQRRIVAKLDRLSARSAAARDHLARTTKLATRAKQAILSSLLADISMKTIPLGDLATEIRYGTSKKCGYESGVTPVLRIPNVAAGRIDTTDLKFANFDAKELSKLSLAEGDLLVIRSNGSLDLVGRSAVVPPETAGHLFAGYLIRVRVDRERTDPLFLQLIMMSTDARRFIERLAKSTSGVNNINSGQIASIPVPVASLDTQRQAVAKARAAFARIDRLTEEANRAAHLLDRLDERLLAKAFCGKLVPQDPDDEPAEALLARIREARAAAPKAKRGRRKKAEA